jgi:hypothetical protein
VDFWNLEYRVELLGVVTFKFRRINTDFKQIFFGHSAYFTRKIRNDLFLAVIAAFFIFFCGGHQWGYRFFCLLIPLNDNYFPKIASFLFFVFISMAAIIWGTALINQDSTFRQQKIAWSLTPILLLISTYLVYALYIEQGFATDKVVAIRLHANWYDYTDRENARSILLDKSSKEFSEGKALLYTIDHSDIAGSKPIGSVLGETKYYYRNGNARIFAGYKNYFAEVAAAGGPAYYWLEGVDEWYDGLCRKYFYLNYEHPTDITIKYSPIRRYNGTYDEPWYNVEHPADLFDIICQAKPIDLSEEESEAFDRWYLNRDIVIIVYEYHTKESNIVRDRIFYDISKQKLFIPEINAHLSALIYNVELPFVLNERQNTIYLPEDGKDIFNFQ